MLGDELSRIELVDRLYTPPDQEPAQDSNQTSAPGSSASALLTVHGVVRNAATGDPLPRAMVRIEGDANTGALTDGEGRFEIAGLPSGQQVFEVLKPGFRDDGGHLESLAMEEVAGAEHNVIVAPGMPDLEFSLSPTGAIHGRIELSTGDPAQGIEVQLLRRMVQDGRAVWQGTAQAKTLSDGTYRFAGLLDGQYVVYTNPAFDNEPPTSLVAPGRGAKVEREGYPSQFYPDARDPAGAAKITLRNGDQAQANLNLMLEPFRAVTATVTFPGNGANGAGPAAGHPGQAFTPVVTDAQGHQLPYTAQYDQATQTVQATLPDGTYSLALTATAGMSFRLSANGDMIVANPRASAAQTEGPFAGSVEFTVAGRAISSLRLPLSAVRGGSVQLNVQRSEDSAAATQNKGKAVLVLLSQAGGWLGDGLSNAYAQGEGPGPIEASYLAPGAYWVHTRFLEKGLCEASFTAGGANLAREPLVLGIAGPSAPIELTARDDCARLTVTLPASLAALNAGVERYYTVYVVPDFDSTTDIEPLILRPTGRTSMTVEGLTPGSYHVYTFSSPVALEYRNREALGALGDAGQSVTLSPGATGSLLLEAPGR